MTSNDAGGRCSVRSIANPSPAMKLAGNGYPAALYRVTASLRTDSSAMSMPAYDPMEALRNFGRSPPFPHAKSRTRSPFRTYALMMVLLICRRAARNVLRGLGLGLG